MDPVNWLERLRDGDPAAMEPLLSEYGPMMDYIVRGILSDVHAREDCLAEVRAKLWERRLLYDPGRASPAAWITALCRNAAYDRLRARRRQEARTRSLEEDHPDPLPGPEEALLRQERANELSRGALLTEPEGLSAVLPQVLLPSVHRPDRGRARGDGAGGGGQALPPAEKSCNICWEVSCDANRRL